MLHCCRRWHPDQQQHGNAMKRFAWVTGLSGTAILPAGVGLGVHAWRFLDRAPLASGVVTELVRSGNKLSSFRDISHIRYETPSRDVFDLASRVGRAPTDQRVGESVTVCFDPANPDDARLKGVMEVGGPASVAGGVCAVFVLIGVGLGLAKRFHAQKRAQLRGVGDWVLATLDQVEIGTGTGFNNRHSWRVHAHWVDPVSGQRHRFVSEMLWEDPGAGVGPSPVQVYRDRGKPGRYAMDLSKQARVAPGSDRAATGRGLGRAGEVGGTGLAL
jgi:hypothetical protein